MTPVWQEDGRMSYSASCDKGQVSLAPWTQKNTHLSSTMHPYQVRSRISFSSAEWVLEEAEVF